MIQAHEGEPKKIYRPTKNARKGTYYVKPTTVTEAKMIRRLERRKHLTGRDVWLLNRLTKGWILYWRYHRYTLENQRHEDRIYTAIPPEYHLRAVKTKPGYT